MEKQGVFVLVLLLIIVLFPSQVLAVPYSVELDDLVAQYALEDSSWSGGTWLGNIHVTDFGEPIAPVESFTFEFWGEVVFPEYIDDQGHISAGEVLSNYRIEDFILCPPGSTSCPDIRLYYATGALLSMESYHRDRSATSGTITDYTLNGNTFHYSRTVESNESEYWQAGFPSGEVYCALVFMHKLEETRPVYQEGSVNVNGARLTIVHEPATPPVADADGPYSIYVGDVLTLDASGSTDADDDIVSYMWDLDDNGSFETDAGSQEVFDVNYTYLESLGLLVDNTYTIHLKVTDSESQSDTSDSTLTIVPKPALKLAVDIKPVSCPNPVNVKSKGVLPIAILGSADYDVTTIDPTSVRLAGVEPLRNSLEDVGRPVSDSNDCNCTTDGPDGFLDLTLKFETQRIVEAVGDVNDRDVLTLELTGVLYDETPIEGADCILIRGRHKPINPADINKDGTVDMADFAIFAQNWLQSSIVED